MTGPVPSVSVVIPTRNRRHALGRGLAALSRQSFPPDRFEVIVVDDGSGDGTAEWVRQVTAPFALALAGTDRPAGAAAARNVGAARASAPILLFLDDDIEASPGLVAEHVRAHERGVTVSIGYLPPVVHGRGGFFAIALRQWWESMFAAMRQQGHRYAFRDLLTGNCAVDASLFREAGGFDDRLTCHEDYELGIRLIASGARFRYVEEAWGFHHEETTLARALQRKRDEGRADVAILSRHPHLWPALPVGFFDAHAWRRQRLLRTVALRSPRGVRAAGRALRAALATHEAVRRRGRWHLVLEELLALAYWEGVRAAVGHHAGFGLFRQRVTASAARQEAPLELDLASGLRRCMEAIEARRPRAARLRYGDQPVGLLPDLPGSEALRGEHLRASLARELSPSLLRALGRAGVAPVTVEGRTAATGLLPACPLEL